MRTAGLLCWFVVFCSAGAWAAPPLEEVIDRKIEQRAGRTLRPATDEYEFLRRVYLDLAGRIPTLAEIEQFVGDSRSDKRRRLIRRLLQSPWWAQRMSEAINVMLIERRGEDPRWMAYLRRSFLQNKPWDRLVREVLSGSPGPEGDLDGVEFFYVVRLKRYGQVPPDQDGLTRDVGRFFLGRDLECANCHDHPFVDDYKQLDYRGLHAFTVNTFLHRQGNKWVVAERVMNAPLEFASVFDKVPHTTGPRLPGGKAFPVPKFDKGQEYLEPPDRKKRTPGVPRFSPRKLLAENLPVAGNRPFVLNSANRFWFLMLGRGLVHPLDYFHADNPPSHPELLDELGRTLVQEQFDLRRYLAHLAASRTYQQPGTWPKEGPTPPETFLTFHQKPLSPEQLAAAVLVATGHRLDLVQMGVLEPEQAKQLPAEAVRTPGASPPRAWREYRRGFQKAFAGPAKQAEVDFIPAVKGTLFVMNDPLVLELLEPRPGNLSARLLEQKDNAQAVRTAYLAVLCRLPGPEEQKEMAAYLASYPDRARAVKNLLWALLASVEFRVNH